MLQQRKTAVEAFRVHRAGERFERIENRTGDGLMLGRGFREFGHLELNLIYFFVNVY